jgi:hypothetical protein
LAPQPEKCPTAPLRRVFASARTGGTPVPHGMRRLFVGCVMRHEYVSHRAQITPPRNTPEPKPLPVTNPTGLSSTCTGGTPSLFVGCVTRHACYQDRAQISPPRNTPEPRPQPVTNPLVCSRGRFYCSKVQRIDWLPGCARFPNVWPCPYTLPLL